MTIQDLSKYYLIKKEVQKLKDRLTEIESTIISSSKISDMKVDSSRNINSPVEITANRIIKLKAKLEKEIAKSYDEELKLENFISDIEDKTVKLIIRLRFKDGMTWQEVADELSYDRSTPYKKLTSYLESHSE